MSHSMALKYRYSQNLRIKVHILPHRNYNPCYYKHHRVITSLFVQMNAQLDFSRNVKTYIKIYIKILLHVSA